MRSPRSVTDIEAENAGARELAARFAERVRSHFGTRLARVILYGSAARGEWTPESDIDVLVLLDRVMPEDGDWLSLQAVRLGLLDRGLLLQPLYMPEADFERLKARERAFALEVEREGIPL
jgi:predicted nucleotidyltransferase